jgi:uncharacterized membrane protein
MDSKVVDFMNQLQQGAGQLGRQVLDMATMTMYWQSLAALVVGGVLTIVGLTLFVYAYRKLRFYESIPENISISSLSFWVDGILGVVGLISILAGCIQTLDVWNWVGVFSPRAALFYQIYDKLINK